MNEEKKVVVGRKDIVKSYREAKVKWVQERINKDPYLAMQTAMDPIGILSKFGLIDPTDDDVYVKVVRGSLLDLVHLREETAARGLANVVEAAEQKPHVGIDIDIDIEWDDCKIEIHIHL